MVKIAIVYHSGYGHTAVQAQHVQQGATEVEGASATLYKVDEIMDNLSVLDDADAIIFGSPTYMGSVSAPFKAFMDASAKTWLAQGWKDKLAAGFTNSMGLSGDKFNTLIQMVTFAAQHSMLWVSLGQPTTPQEEGAQTGHPTTLNRVGSYLGAMAQSENAAPEDTPPSGDLDTAKVLGRRVAEMAKRFK